MKIIIKFIFTSFVVLATTLSIASPADGQAVEGCSTLKDATPQQELAYLKGDRSSLDPKCIQLALHDLGQLQYLPSIPTLIQYLDFKNITLYRDAFRPMGGEYPAANALAQMGKYAIPDVKSAVANESLNRRQRRNAAALYAGTLSRDLPSNIKFLLQSSKQSKDAQVSLDLVDLAKELADDCPPSSEKECYEALNGN